MLARPPCQPAFPIQSGIAGISIRNSHLLAIASTGAISLLAGNVSSGLEPIFAACYSRNVLAHDGTPKEFILTDYALDLWRRMSGLSAGTPTGLVSANELPVRAHLEMQAALHTFVGGSISKTINVPENTAFGDFKQIYDLAYNRGVKGCTTFRANPVTGVVLSEKRRRHRTPHGCVAEREAD